jgi:two-component system response regulator YesN
MLEIKAFSIAEEIRQIVEDKLNFTVSIGIGNVCNGVENLSKCYKHAVSALNHRFIQGKNQVISISGVENQKSIVYYNRIE